jgi:ankyrin repeat protein
MFRRIATTLTLSALKGYVSMVIMLIEGGAKLDAKTNEDFITLCLATHNENETVSRLLIGKGAEVDTKSNEGYTPLAASALNGHITMMRLLADRDLMLDLKKSKG